ncbi:MAG: PhoH family protein [Candidatus Theseobacter exili]|nr:PhoH family protein [Candidatus Theseobacter exili]
MNEIIKISDTRRAHYLYGNDEDNIQMIEKKFHVKVVVRDCEITISGRSSNVQRAKVFFEELNAIRSLDCPLSKTDFVYALSTHGSRKNISLNDIYSDRINVSNKKGYVIPKTKNQKEYIDSIRSHDIVFGIGPAGTGKTYLSMAMAVSALLSAKYSRIILTRPAVEAGESLGFLPGNLLEKINPYLRPLYDALYDMIEIDRIQKLLDKGVIEVASLAFMRGRTLNDSFIILDEAQNTTIEQMKMFLTRLGFNSKAVITGDITQIDLPKKHNSGLLQANRIFNEFEGISVLHFNEHDVVRHPLVQRIVKAYEQEDMRIQSSRGKEE